MKEIILHCDIAMYIIHFINIYIILIIKTIVNEYSILNLR